MRTAEDVKLRPIPGDTARNEIGSVRVEAVHPFEAVGMFPDTAKRIGVSAAGNSRILWHSIIDWRKWSATAEVIHIAQPAGTAGEEA